MNDNSFKNVFKRVTLEDRVSNLLKQRGTQLNQHDYINRQLHSYKSSYNGSCVLQMDCGIEGSQGKFTDKRFQRFGIGSVNKFVETESGVKAKADEYSLKMCVRRVKTNLVYSVLWFMVHMFAVVISYVYIKSAFLSWQTSPVVQALSNTQVHFENISFPAVTICWLNDFKLDFDLFDNIDNCISCTENKCTLKKPTCNRTEMATLALVREMCLKYFLTRPLPSEVYRFVPFSINSAEFDAYMEKLLPECEYDVIVGRASDLSVEKLSRCNGIVFQQFYSPSLSEGLCMTYNSLRFKDIFKKNVVTPVSMTAETIDAPVRVDPGWSFDNMMEFNGSKDTVPKYGIERYTIIIQKKVRKYKKTCNLAENAATITIHSPNEIPLNRDKGNEYYLSDNFGIRMFIEPKITLAKDLAQYPSHQRGCLYAHERNLTMFKFYSKLNCDIECFVNSSLEHCGCVPFAYPRQNRSVPICLHRCSPRNLRCDCLPDCNSLAYDVTTHEVSLLGVEFPNTTVQAILDIRLKSDKYYTTVRYSMTGVAEFVAYSLGVLGAFLGLSLTCSWKVMYFGLLGCWATVKDWCHSEETFSPRNKLNDMPAEYQTTRVYDITQMKHPGLIKVQNCRGSDRNLE